MMPYFPLFMDIEDQAVLVVGGGRVAARKLRLLLQAGARPRVVARRLDAEVVSWLKAGRIDWPARVYRARHLEGVRLVFAATGNAELNRRIFADAEARCIPVNAVDDRQHCRFVTPAMVNRPPLQVAVCSGGTAPVLARHVRGWIERLLPQGLGRIATSAGRLRQQVQQRLPVEQRRRFWDALLSERQILKWSNRPESSIVADMRGALKKPAADHDPGRVILVGAGPGRADLLTLRALQVLSRADVILHDKLVSGDILELARRDADRIDVGKRAGRHCHSQDRINRLMLEHARCGRTVVRLKGGDAFVFGRGGEELEFLRAHGIDYEVVPGITAATGCAAYAGIPLTHRQHAQVVSLVTGHAAESSTELDWSQLAGPGRTVVVYMGLRQARRLRDRLLAAGVAATLPVAMIGSGTRDEQQVASGNVAGLPELAAACSGEPGLFVIGQVARFADRLAWFDAANLPHAARHSPSQAPDTTPARRVMPSRISASV